MSALILASLLAVAAPLPAAAQEVHAFNVVAADPASAIRAFGVQAGLQILASADDLRGKKLNPVSGKISTEQALNNLLAGTGLDHRYVGDRAVALVADSTAAGSEQNQAPQAAKDKPAADPVDTKNTRSDKFRLAQADQGPASNPPKKSQQPSEKKPVWIEEIIVTGSRIPRVTREGPQEVKIYTKEDIERSGQTTVADFLNTLPDAAQIVSENATNAANSGVSLFGATTVQLHGLPIGTTLVLLNGRRVEVSGALASSDFFDLNTIPLAAVDSVEVVPAGSSAVYGSDAIAGVVNIKLKKTVSGFEANTNYGEASGTHDWTSNLALGGQWSKGSALIVGSYQIRTELSGAARSITADNNYTRFGGSDIRVSSCNPGNVFSPDGVTPLPGLGNATYAAVPKGFSGTPSITEFQGTAGTLNLCSAGSLSDIIPETRRTGLLFSANYNPTASIEFFTELMYSHTEELVQLGPLELASLPQFNFFQFTVPASNPYNPFGTTVAIGDTLASPGAGSLDMNTAYVRALAGATGNLSERWHWEIAAWDSQDTTNNPSYAPDSNAIQTALNATTPQTALNPFVSEPQGSSQLLRSFLIPQFAKYVGRALVANGFLRGPAFNLPAGPVDVVVGAEYDRSKLYQDLVAQVGTAPNTTTNYSRSTYAGFAEARVPIIGHRASPSSSDRLVVSLAGRYDHYSDFGSKTTPQFGVEWRPTNTLLIRGAYTKSFKAPSLFDLDLAPATFPNSLVVDPQKGNRLEFVNLIFGGNRNLHPETGQSSTFGIAYSSEANPNLQLSVTHWKIDETNSIQPLGIGVIVHNESLFPGKVVRDSNGVITQVTAGYVNFGEIHVSGLDYQINYKVRTAFGQLAPSMSITQTYSYSAAFQPGLPPTDRTSVASDDGNWAPRWKGTVALGWELGPCAASVDARYLSRYQDYGSTNVIGNFWLYDGNINYAIGRRLARENGWLNGSYLSLGGVNLFNRLPQYSNFGGGGYDPTQADIRGRFLYARLGSRW